MYKVMYTGWRASDLELMAGVDLYKYVYHDNSLSKINMPNRLSVYAGVRGYLR